MMNFSLDDFTLDNIGKWPQWIKFTVTLCVSLILIAAGYQFLIRPDMNQYQVELVKEKTLKVEFEKDQKKASNLEAYRAQIKEIAIRFGDLLKKLPTHNEMPGLLDEISKTGTASGLTFDLFAPQPEIKHDFYIELPINISVTGSYYQLAIFLSHVAAMDRIVTLHDFTIEGPSLDKVPETDKTKHLNGDQLHMKIQATIYRYRTQ